MPGTGALGRNALPLSEAQLPKTTTAAGPVVREVWPSMHQPLAPAITKPPDIFIAVGALDVGFDPGVQAARTSPAAIRQALKVCINVAFALGAGVGAGAFASRANQLRILPERSGSVDSFTCARPGSFAGR